MEQQGGTEEFERDEAAMALAILSIHDIQFLNGLRNDLESTLWRYGFALSPWEMQAIRGTFDDEQNFGLSDEEIVEKLEEKINQEYRIWPF